MPPLDINKIAFFGPWNINTTYTKDNCYLFKNKHGKVIIIDTDRDGEKEEFTMFACPSLAGLEMSNASAIVSVMLNFRDGQASKVANLYEKEPQTKNMDGRDDCWTSFETLSKKYSDLGDKLEKLLPKLRRHGSAPTLDMLGVKFDILSSNGKPMDFTQWVKKNTSEEKPKYNWESEGIFENEFLRKN